MASKNCSACTDLTTYAPDFILNGVTDAVDASLRNDTGFNPKNDRDDCTDLNDAADCLIGNMNHDIDSHDVCDWKTYLHELVPNIYNMFKASISAICGIWTRIHKLECEVNYLYQGKRFKIGENETDGSYVVAGKGISFLEAVANQETHTSEIYLTYIAGGLMRGSGSLIWRRDDFCEPNGKTCHNFDIDGKTLRESNDRKGNKDVFEKTGRPADGGELIYEIRIKKSAFPQIRDIYSGFGHEGSGGAYRVNVSVFDGGTEEKPVTTYAYGQHGSCNGVTGKGADGNSDGHTVEAGWWYVQVRLNYNDLPFGDGHQYTPQYFIGVRMNQDGIDC